MQFQDPKELIINIRFAKSKNLKILENTWQTKWQKKLRLAHQCNRTPHQSNWLSFPCQSGATLLRLSNFRHLSFSTMSLRLPLKWLIALRLKASWVRKPFRASLKMKASIGPTRRSDEFQMHSRHSLLHTWLLTVQKTSKERKHLWQKKSHQEVQFRNLKALKL